jgi:hypothetical protein
VKSRSILGWWTVLFGGARLMTKKVAAQSRTGLGLNQIAALERTLNTRKYGRLIDTKKGSSYGKYEAVARVGEELTGFFTQHFSKKGSRVHFTLLGSKIANAYAIWQQSFETISLTSRMAMEVEALAGYVAKYLAERSSNDSGFSYVHDIPLESAEREAALKSLLLQGAVAFLIGHEAGHLAAGHKPILLGTAMATAQRKRRRTARGVVLDRVVMAKAVAGPAQQVKNSLRLNAHEVDADVQGIALTAAYWLSIRGELQTSTSPPVDAALMLEACAQPERLLLLASTGAAIALSMFGYKAFEADWSNQCTHPLTAVRCVVALGALGKLMIGHASNSALELCQECTEALMIVHQRLASLYLEAADADGQSSPVEQMLRAAAVDERMQLILRVTGIAQAVENSSALAGYLSELSAEFDSCGETRRPYIRVSEDSLLRWTAVEEKGEVSMA